MNQFRPRHPLDAEMFGDLPAQDQHPGGQQKSINEYAGSAYFHARRFALGGPQQLLSDL
jgi:hypothetical protein